MTDCIKCKNPIFTQPLIMSACLVGTNACDHYSIHHHCLKMHKNEMLTTDELKETVEGGIPL